MIQFAYEKGLDFLEKQTEEIELIPTKDIKEEEEEEEEDENEELINEFGQRNNLTNTTFKVTPQAGDSRIKATDNGNYHYTLYGNHDYH